mmetsp:Transcript_13037/g.25325  ORF Transcript_13037/g.25325 Transcript_13037/m.25325 type:complete len:318 (-) Transcript_13037:1298-2251(-)
MHFVCHKNTILLLTYIIHAKALFKQIHQQHCSFRAFQKLTNGSCALSHGCFVCSMLRVIVFVVVMLMFTMGVNFMPVSTATSTDTHSCHTTFSLEKDRHQRISNHVVRWRGIPAETHQVLLEKDFHSAINHEGVASTRHILACAFFTLKDTANGIPEVNESAVKWHMKALLYSCCLQLGVHAQVIRSNEAICKVLTNQVGSKTRTWGTHSALHKLTTISLDNTLFLEAKVYRLTIFGAEKLCTKLSQGRITTKIKIKLSHLLLLAVNKNDIFRLQLVDETLGAWVIRVCCESNCLDVTINCKHGTIKRLNFLDRPSL